MKEDPDFIEHHKVDLAASLEATVVDILMDKLRKAAKEYKIKEVAVAGGVSANNGLRNAFREHAEKYGWNIFIPISNIWIKISALLSFRLILVSPYKVIFLLSLFRLIICMIAA